MGANPSIQPARIHDVHEGGLERKPEGLRMFALSYSRGIEKKKKTGYDVNDSQGPSEEKPEVPHFSNPITSQGD